MSDIDWAALKKAADEWEAQCALSDGNIVSFPEYDWCYQHDDLYEGEHFDDRQCMCNGTWTRIRIA